MKLMVFNFLYSEVLSHSLYLVKICSKNTNIQQPLIKILSTLEMDWLYDKKIPSYSQIVLIKQCSWQLAMYLSRSGRLFLVAKNP